MKNKDKTAIEWTHIPGYVGATWNPWQGCEKLSPGCKNCYMYRDKKRYGQDPYTPVRSKTTFNQPLKWKEPHAIFTCSWSDWFIEQADAWRDEAWEIIRKTPQHIYLILTKRPERIAAHLPNDWGNGWDNVWLGVSVESHDYLWRIDELIKIKSLTIFLSMEPLLENVDLSNYLGKSNDSLQAQRRVCLPVSDERRSGNKNRRNDLEDSQTRMGSVEEESRQSSMQTSEGRAQCGGILSGQGYDQRDQNIRIGSPAGVETLQRFNPNRDDHQPQGRGQEAQPDNKSGAGDLFGTADSRDTDSKVVIGAGSRNQRAQEDRGETCFDSERLRHSVSDGIENNPRRQAINLVIVGGESGPNFRPMNPDWARSIRDQCKAAGVPFFMKQMAGGLKSALPPIPDDLKIREFPTSEIALRTEY